MNAIEAAFLYTPPGDIACFVEQVDGVPKIGICNDAGPPTRATSRSGANGVPGPAALFVSFAGS
jgi:hypothetical protein